MSLLTTRIIRSSQLKKNLKKKELRLEYILLEFNEVPRSLVHEFLPSAKRSGRAKSI